MGSSLSDQGRDETLCRGALRLELRAGEQPLAQQDDASDELDEPSKDWDSA